MTLLFCPLFLDEPGRIERNLSWLEFYKPLQHILGFDQILMVDNASSHDNLRIIENAHPDVFIIRKELRLKRLPPQGYGMWYRAQAEAANYAKIRNFDRIIHIDSDAYILSKRFAEHLKGIKTGWSTFWCPKHGFPEVNIQVIGNERFADMYRFHTEGFLEFYPYEVAEIKIPFTHIDHHFVGDRYGEDRRQQSPDMDYYCQAVNDIPLKFDMKGET